MSVPHQYSSSTCIVPDLDDDHHQVPTQGDQDVYPNNISNNSTDSTESIIRDYQDINSSIRNIDTDDILNSIRQSQLSLSSNFYAERGLTAGLGGLLGTNGDGSKGSTHAPGVTCNCSASRGSSFVTPPILPPSSSSSASVPPILARLYALEQHNISLMRNLHAACVSVSQLQQMNAQLAQSMNRFIMREGMFSQTTQSQQPASAPPPPPPPPPSQPDRPSDIDEPTITTTTTATTMSIIDLPDHALISIFSYLDKPYNLRFTSACQRMHTIGKLTSSVLLWFTRDPERLEDLNEQISDNVEEILERREEYSPENLHIPPPLTNLFNLTTPTVLKSLLYILANENHNHTITNKSIFRKTIKSIWRLSFIIGDFDLIYIILSRPQLKKYLSYTDWIVAFAFLDNLVILDLFGNDFDNVNMAGRVIGRKHHNDDDEDDLKRDLLGMRRYLKLANLRIESVDEMIEERVKREEKEVVYEFLMREVAGWKEVMAAEAAAVVDTANGNGQNGDADGDGDDDDDGDSDSSDEDVRRTREDVCGFHLVLSSARLGSLTLLESLYATKPPPPIRTPRPLREPGWPMVLQLTAMKSHWQLIPFISQYLGLPTEIENGKSVLCQSWGFAITKSFHRDRYDVLESLVSVALTRFPFDLLTGGFNEAVRRFCLFGKEYFDDVDGEIVTVGDVKILEFVEMLLTEMPACWSTDNPEYMKVLQAAFGEVDESGLMEVKLGKAGDDEDLEFRRIWMNEIAESRLGAARMLAERLFSVWGVPTEGEHPFITLVKSAFVVDASSTHRLKVFETLEGLTTVKNVWNAIAGVAADLGECQAAIFRTALNAANSTSNRRNLMKSFLDHAVEPAEKATDPRLTILKIVELAVPGGCLLSVDDFKDLVKSAVCWKVEKRFDGGEVGKMKMWEEVRGKVFEGLLGIVYALEKDEDEDENDVNPWGVLEKSEVAESISRSDSNDTLHDQTQDTVNHVSTQTDPLKPTPRPKHLQAFDSGLVSFISQSVPISDTSAVPLVTSNLSMVRKLVEAGGRFDRINERTEAVYQLIGRGDVDTLQYLFDNGIVRGVFVKGENCEKAKWEIDEKVEKVVQTEYVSEKGKTDDGDLIDLKLNGCFSDVQSLLATFTTEAQSENRDVAWGNLKNELLEMTTLNLWRRALMTVDPCYGDRNTESWALMALKRTVFANNGGNKVKLDPHVLSSFLLRMMIEGRVPEVRGLLDMEGTSLENVTVELGLVYTGCLSAFIKLVGILCGGFAESISQTSRWFLSRVLRSPFISLPDGGDSDSVKEVVEMEKNLVVLVAETFKNWEGRWDAIGVVTQDVVENGELFCVFWLRRMQTLLTELPEWNKDVFSTSSLLAELLLKAVASNDHVLTAVLLDFKVQSHATPQKLSHISIDTSPSSEDPCRTIFASALRILQAQEIKTMTIQDAVLQAKKEFLSQDIDLGRPKEEIENLSVDGVLHGSAVLTCFASFVNVTSEPNSNPFAIFTSAKMSFTQPTIPDPKLSPSELSLSQRNSLIEYAGWLSLSRLDLSTPSFGCAILMKALSCNPGPDAKEIVKMLMQRGASLEKANLKDVVECLRALVWGLKGLKISDFKWLKGVAAKGDALDDIDGEGSLLDVERELAVCLWRVVKIIAKMRPEAITADQEYLMDFACDGEFEEMLTCFLKAGGDPNKTQIAPPLNRAVSSSWRRGILLLREAGATPDTLTAKDIISIAEVARNPVAAKLNKVSWVGSSKSRLQKQSRDALKTFLEIMEPGKNVKKEVVKTAEELLIESAIADWGPPSNATTKGNTVNPEAKMMSEWQDINEWVMESLVSDGPGGYHRLRHGDDWPHVAATLISSVVIKASSDICIDIFKRMFNRGGLEIRRSLVKALLQTVRKLMFAWPSYAVLRFEAVLEGFAIHEMYTLLQLVEYVEIDRGVSMDIQPCLNALSQLRNLIASIEQPDEDGVMSAMQGLFGDEGVEDLGEQSVLASDNVSVDDVLILMDCVWKFFLLWAKGIEGVGGFEGIWDVDEWVQQPPWVKYMKSSEEKGISQSYTGVNQMQQSGLYGDGSTVTVNPPFVESCLQTCYTEYNIYQTIIANGAEVAKRHRQKSTMVYESKKTIAEMQANISKLGPAIEAAEKQHKVKLFKSKDTYAQEEVKLKELRDSMIASQTTLADAQARFAAAQKELDLMSRAISHVNQQRRKLMVVVTRILALDCRHPNERILTQTCRKSIRKLHAMTKHRYNQVEFNQLYWELIKDVKSLHALRMQIFESTQGLNPSALSYAPNASANTDPDLTQAELSDPSYQPDNIAACFPIDCQKLSDLFTLGGDDQNVKPVPVNIFDIADCLNIVMEDFEVLKVLEVLKVNRGGKDAILKYTQNQYLGKEIKFEDLEVPEPSYDESVWILKLFLRYLNVVVPFMELNRGKRI
ncbi:hypothetical protein HDU76_008199 [Blyttiomyces sp. JEL0837]|nr:hypothetical protein HDU76_008199 [Blyttiomyces sp. JEL0837]